MSKKILYLTTVLFSVLCLVVYADDYSHDENDTQSSLNTKPVGEKFGKEATNYTAGRRGYGEAIYVYLKEIIKTDANILDIGCGTGIATRELYAHGFHNIQGCDIDPFMILEAEQRNKQLNFPIPYKVANVLDLPQVFGNEQFDVISAFTCFHWFCNQEAIEIISNKLKPDGIFIVVSSTRANMDEAILKEFWSIIEQISGKPVFDPRPTYHPKEMLKSYGFLVENHTWTHNEYLTFEEVMARLQTFSGWCALTNEQKQRGLPLLEEFVKKRASILMHRTVNTNCLIAKLPNA